MSNNSSLENLLKLICLLQNNSKNPCITDNNCTKPFLGPSISNICYNTRVISLYKKDGSLFSVNFVDSNNNNVTSSLFRVMNVFNGCCNLLILDNINDNYISTNQFITIDLNCICAVRCLIDINLEDI